MGLAEITGSYMGRQPKPDPRLKQWSSTRTDERVEPTVIPPDERLAPVDPESPEAPISRMEIVEAAPDPASDWVAPLLSQPTRPMEPCQRTAGCPKKYKHVGACKGHNNLGGRPGAGRTQVPPPPSSVVSVDISKLRTSTGTMVGATPLAHDGDPRLCTLVLIRALEEEIEANQRLIALLRKRL